MMSENGHIRPSDRGGPDDFKQLDRVRFGESGERPPDLSAFAVGAKVKQQPIVHPLYSAEPQNAATAGAKFMERQKMRAEREKFLKQEQVVSAPTTRPGAVGGGASSLTLKELVKARESAQQAYAALRQKRLKANVA